MSIVIDIDAIPKNCAECPLAVHFDFDSTVRCAPLYRTGKIPVFRGIAKRGRMKECPLHEAETHTEWHWGKATEPCPYP